MLAFFFLKGKHQVCTDWMQPPGRSWNTHHTGLPNRMKGSQTVFEDLAQMRKQEMPTGCWGGGKLKAKGRQDLKECDAEKEEQKQDRSWEDSYGAHISVGEPRPYGGARR